MTDSTQRNPETADSCEAELPTSGVRLVSPAVAAPDASWQKAVLTHAALDFLAGLHRRFEAERQIRLTARRARQARFDAGELPRFEGAEGLDDETGSFCFALQPPCRDGAALRQHHRLDLAGDAEDRALLLRV